MKTCSKFFTYAAVAAFALSSCTSEKLKNDNLNEGKTVTVHFGAETTDPSSKATLTPNGDETAFQAAWENNDKINVRYTYVVDGIPRTTLGIWNSSTSKFSADITDLTTGEEVLKMKYQSSFPYSDNGYVDFGSARTQTGAKYNSVYDLMIADAVTVTAKPGLDESGNAIVFPMQRQTAIAYFHFTSNNKESITKAKLKVEGEGAAIAAQTLLLDPTGMDYETGLSEIELTTTGQTADDFTLWFNVLPTSYTSMTLTVETATKTFTISKSSEGTYEAGKLYKVKKENIEWANKTVYAYKKIIDQSELTDGSYLIVNDDYSFAVAGSKTATDLQKGGAGTNVEIRNKIINHSANLAENAFEIKSIPGGYSIKGSKCGYIGYSSTGKNGLQGHSTTAYVNNISVAEGIATITTKNSSNTTYTLCCNPNNNSPLVKYYKTVSDTYKPISLYKYQAVDASLIPTQYKVTIVPVTGGTLSATPSQAEAGAKITLSAMPNYGYAFNKWIVTNEKTLEEITVEDDKFTMPAANVRVSASFTQTGTGASITINSTTENFPSEYGEANTFSEYTLNGLKYMIQQVYVNGAKLQWRASGNSSGTGTMYNSDEMPAGIASIVITFNSSDSNKNHTVKIGNSANPTSSSSITPTKNGSIYTYKCDGSSKYFVITNGSGAGYIDSIVINFN